MDKRMMLAAGIWSAAVFGCDSYAENRAEEEAEEQAEARGADPLTEERAEERAEERIEQAQHAAQAKEDLAPTTGAAAPSGTGTIGTGAAPGAPSPTVTPSPTGTTPPTGTGTMQPTGATATQSEGIIRMQSERPYRETTRQLERELTKSGMVILTKIDYTRTLRRTDPNAASMQVYVVGDAQADVESLRMDPTRALTASRRVLVYQEAREPGATGAAAAESPVFVAYEQQIITDAPVAPSRSADRLDSIVRTATIRAVDNAAGMDTGATSPRSTGTPVTGTPPLAPGSVTGGGMQDPNDT